MPAISTSSRVTIFEETVFEREVIDTHSREERLSSAFLSTLKLPKGKFVILSVTGGSLKYRYIAPDNHWFVVKTDPAQRRCSEKIVSIHGEMESIRCFAEFLFWVQQDRGGLEPILELIQTLDPAKPSITPALILWETIFWEGDETLWRTILLRYGVTADDIAALYRNRKLSWKARVERVLRAGDAWAQSDGSKTFGEFLRDFQ